MTGGYETVTLHPRWWFLATVAGFGLAVVLGARALFNVRLAGLEIVTVVVPAVLWHGMRVTLGSDGVTFMKKTVPWPTVELRRIRWTGLSLTSPAGVPWRERLVVTLFVYESNWRQAQIGATVGTFRPDLLDAVAGHP